MSEVWVLYIVCVALSLLIGALLSKYHAWVLFPATVCVITLGIVIGVLQKASGLVILEGLLGPWVALDAGYMLGSAYFAGLFVIKKKRRFIRRHL